MRIHGNVLPFLGGLVGWKQMEEASGLSTRPNSNAFSKEKGEENESSDIKNLELETLVKDIKSEYHDPPMNVLEILRESVRVLRYNSTALLSIVAVLICPVSTILLSNVLVDQSLVKWLTVRLLLVFKSSGLPLKTVVEQSCQKFSEMAVSITMCFPLFMSLLLLSKAAVVYSVDCTYSRKQFDRSMFHAIISMIWNHILFTYLLACAVISSCLALFIVFLNLVSSLFFIMGCPPDIILYPALVVGLLFAVFLANATNICNIAVVISILEEVSGPQAFLRSISLVRGQNQVGLLIFLGTTMGLAFVEFLFEHRVKTLSYGDGSSRIWEGPLLVVMYSCVLLIDSMMNTIFYFSCKSYSMESTNEESHHQPVLEALNVAAESMDAE